MNSFISACQCQGRQPEGVVTSSRHARPGLISRMLRDRRVARLLAAPVGSGKSSLAFEYASVVFSFRHVFWVKGTSPCFLRDLDAGSLARGICATDPEAALVVFDDVPPLSDERASAFSETIDGLLENGVEVVATCVPSADATSALQRDCILLGSTDLLLSEEEMEAEASSGRLRQGWEGSCIPADRIACVRWSAQGAGVLLAGLASEELPSDVRLVALLALALGHGDLQELEAFLPAARAREAVELLGKAHPSLGFDARSGMFCTVEASGKMVSHAFGRKLDDLAEPSSHETRDQLCQHISDVLVRRGEVSRSLDMVGSLATKAGAAAWLARQGPRILAGGDAYPFLELHARIQRESGPFSGQLLPLRCWASFMLGDVAAVRGLVRRACAPSVPLASRMACQVLAVRTAAGAGSEAAALGLHQLLDAASRATVAANEAESLSAEGMDWGCLGSIAWLLARQPALALAAWFHERAGAPSKGEAARSHRSSLLVASAWIIDERLAHDGDPSTSLAEAGLPRYAEVAAPRRATLDELASLVGDAVEQEAATGRLGWCATVAGGALERLCAQQPRFAAYLPSPAASALLHKEEVSLCEQRGALAASKEERVRKARQYDLTHPDAFRTTAPAADASLRVGVPVLRVRLFGGLQVSIGGEVVSSPELKRSKTRELLALLALNHGRELGRDRIARALWPDSSHKMAVKSFYGTWSRLRRALMVGDHCPYLVRTQSGCSLDERLLSCDVDEFRAVCRQLLFGSGEEGEWERTYARVCEQFADVLLPCERGCEEVSSMRQRYHVELVDALIAASKRLGARGEPRGALWFAREAVRRDDRREDAYVALMEAQILSDQRRDALDTYFSCRRFLSEELGIDPSTHLVGLYQSVIASEEALA